MKPETAELLRVHLPRLIEPDLPLLLRNDGKYSYGLMNALREGCHLTTSGNIMFSSCADFRGYVVVSNKVRNYRENIIRWQRMSLQMRVFHLDNPRDYPFEADLVDEVLALSGHGLPPSV